MDASSHKSEMNEIEREINALLKDDVFQRSPVMARLLKYLFEMTEKKVHVKSFTIATDALGKTGEESSDADTYARVAVARLRRVLATYYAARPERDAIHVDSGTYRVQLLKHPIDELSEPSEDRDAPATGNPDPRGKIARGVWTWAIALVMLVSGVATSYFYFGSDDDETENWTTSDFPRLTINIENLDGSSPQPDESQRLYRSFLTSALSDYTGIRLLVNEGGPADFSLRLLFSDEESNRAVQARLVEEATGEVVWLQSFSASNSQEAKRSIKFISTAIASPGGVITSLNRGRDLGASSPYGCWLRFTEGLQTFNTIGDDDLVRCASDWYEQSPGDSIASFLYGWTLLDRAVVTAFPGDRDELLSSALSIANRAVALHPQDASLYFLQLRAHVLLGNRILANQSAESALAAAPDNRVIVGIVATFLIMSDNPEGEKILRVLDDEEGVALPWEHAGHFVAAMMRDDVAEAGQHMVHLEQFAQRQPLLLLLRAALASRSGEVEIARSALKQLRDNPRMAKDDIGGLVGSLPMAPKVKTRLNEWLAFSTLGTSSDVTSKSKAPSK
ncbi:hypothetical protein G6N82_01155 [Altererythrobacter sp. BO-6]|uniref:tetratricopeptide repeat protein n=1 Tax=Altererythrobacter sp. BO-6 TaxID=2604537 RepID=UPI0013E18E1B|nr:hypothetical protein [Altererythrobacter sp. BO-6]QIG52954.1 hypothetical protein G6N82_01155 [Altererythrobacter sp. BO-6]